MKTLLLIAFLCASAMMSLAQGPSPTAVILERSTGAPDREMVLWMDAPTKHPREAGEDDIYTCPDNTRGHYYSGVAHVSLYAPSKRKYLNDLRVEGDGAAEGDVIDLPFLIQRTGYYDVPRVGRKGGEGKPVLMKLMDYNGDGRAQEFALFDAVACMGLATTLIGYDAATDSVIQYETQLKLVEGRQKLKWVDYLFGRKPDKDGVYRYQIDYRGRGGTLDKYEVRYDRKRRMFVGTLQSIPERNDSKPPSK